MCMHECFKVSVLKSRKVMCNHVSKGIHTCLSHLRLDLCVIVCLCRWRDLVLGWCQPRPSSRSPHSSSWGRSHGWVGVGLCPPICQSGPLNQKALFVCLTVQSVMVTFVFLREAHLRSVSVSPLMANKDALTQYACTFREVQELLDFHRAQVEA